MDKSAGKHSIRARIFIMLLSLICIVLLLITIAFNILVNIYISSNAESQLAAGIQMARDFPGFRENNGNTNKPPEQQMFFPDPAKMPKGPMRLQTEAFIASVEYSLLSSEAGMVFSQEDMEKYSHILNNLKSKNISLSTDKAQYISTEYGDYYMTFLKKYIPWMDREEYLVFLVDVTGIKTFASKINIMLAIIVVFGVILSLALAALFSGRIAKPIKDLSQFAERIGRGDFTQSNIDYYDKELWELSSSMNRTARQLDSFDKDQKTFFQNVSHELRTPLMSIKCYAEGIEYSVTDTVKSAQIISNETDRLNEMVEDLLYLSRMDNITNLQNNAVYDLREILSSCAERQRSIADKRKIEFVYDFDEKPVQLECDEKHIARAFSNILSNAVRYAKSKVTLYCRQTEDTVMVYVADDGQGISEEDLPHIFDRFYKGADGKHGIGLSIVKAVVTQYGGQIRAESGEGAKLLIEFPRID